MKINVLLLSWILAQHISLRADSAVSEMLTASQPANVSNDDAELPGSSQKRLKEWLPGKGWVGKWQYGEFDAVFKDGSVAFGQYTYQWKVSGAREVTLSSAGVDDIKIVFNKDFTKISSPDRKELEGTRK